MRWIILSLLALVLPALALDLRGRAVICVLAKDQKTCQRLVSMIKERRDALKIGYDPVTGKGIPIYDRLLSHQERQRLKINNQDLPCGSIIKFSNNGTPEKIMGNPPAVQARMNCLFEADLMISRLLNLESEKYCVQRTGLSLETVRYIRNLTKPNLELVYCVGRSGEEADQLDLAYLISQTRHKRPPPITVHVSQDALSDEILTGWGLTRDRAPFMAIIINSAQGNPSVLKPESLIANLDDQRTAAEAMSFFQETGQMPASVKDKLPPLALVSASLDNAPIPGSVLNYGLELDHVKPAAPPGNTFHLKAILQDSHDQDLAQTQSELKAEITNFRTHLSCQINLPPQMLPGTYYLIIKVTDLLSSQEAATRLVIKIGEKTHQGNMH